MGRQISICIVSHNAFGSLTGQAGHIGGVELQTAMLARYLAARNHRVSMVTWDEGHPEIETAHGVRVLRLCRADVGLPLLRFFYPRWTSLNKALNEADADVYYHNGAEYTTGQIAMFCRRNHRAFVFSAASDTDTDPELPALTSLRERILYRYGLRHATKLVVQTRIQQKSLASHFSIQSDILPMPCDTAAIDPVDFDDCGRTELLWVGRVIATKRLELYLDIAERNPQLTFHIAGGADDNDDVEYARCVLERAKQIDNVNVHGSLGRDKLLQLFARVRLLVCTSELEGFPNTFLEAWSFGIPLVSTFDPDNLIKERNLGKYVGNVANLDDAILELLKSEGTWRVASENCKSYFDEHHLSEVALKRFEAVLTGAARA